MPTIAISESVVAYNDTTVNSNPQYVFFSWRRQVSPTVVKNPLETQYVIPPNTTQTLFSGTRTTSIDATTEFSISLNPINSSIYRISNTNGTSPGFRTNRNIVIAGDTLVVAVNNNATATATLTTGNFSSVQAGDTVFVPTIATGDGALNSPFSPSNGGYWTVLSKASGATPKTITLTRLPGQTFNGISESVTPTADSQFIVFSSSGVQVGDSLEISNGFSPVTQTTFEVTGVTPDWVEFFSSVSYPLETGILPDVGGMVFYISNKRYVRIEADQEIVVRLNGNVGTSDQSIRIGPRTAADQNSVGWLEKWGTTYALEVQNRSRNSSVTITVLSAE